MGYYTNFSINQMHWLDENNKYDRELTMAEQEQVFKDWYKIFDKWSEDASAQAEIELKHLKELYHSCEYICDNFIDNYLSQDSMKWYDVEADMIEFSKLYPNLYIELDGQGEEFDDEWRAYIHNGRYHCSQAEHYYPEPDWEDFFGGGKNYDVK